MNKALGALVKDLRNQRNMSQTDLAKEINVSRPTIWQIEKGERSVSLNELLEICRVFSFSPQTLLDIVLGRDQSNNQFVFNEEKFKETLVFILIKIGSRINVGQTVLYKILYYSDFDHCELHGSPITAASYLCNRYGPTPNEFLSATTELIKQDAIAEFQRPTESGYTQTKYFPLLDIGTNSLSQQEIAIIDQEIMFFGNMSAREASDYSHEDEPWKLTEQGEIINYDLVKQRTKKTSAINRVTGGMPMV